MHLPAFDERRLRAGLDRLFPLQVGKESTFGWLDSDTRNLVMSEWRVVRTDDLSIDGDVRRTLVVERRQRAHYQYLGSSLDTFWFDPELGIPLKQTGQVYIGAPAWSRSWTARQLSIARTPVE